jgi:hypothetical protein
MVWKHIMPQPNALRLGRQSAWVRSNRITQRALIGFGNPAVWDYDFAL